MNLAEDRFFINTGVHATQFGSGSIYQFDRFGYETHDAIYDVDLRPYATFFMKNGRECAIHPIHRAIIKRYLKGHHEREEQACGATAESVG